MKTDALYLAAACALQLGFAALGGRVYPDFLAPYGFLVWAGFCAVGFASYPWVRPFHCTAPRFLLASVLAHLAAIFVLSIAVSFVIVVYAVPARAEEWQAELATNALLGALAGVTALLFSYATFCFRRHA